MLEVIVATHKCTGIQSQTKIGQVSVRPIGTSPQLIDACFPLMENVKADA